MSSYINSSYKNIFINISDDPKILREDEETKKILGYDSGGLFHMEDGVIKSVT